MEKRAAAIATEVLIIRGMMLGTRKIDAGEKGFERRVAVDEGGDLVGPILDDGAEGEDEEREKEKREEVVGERSGGGSQKLRGGPELGQPVVEVVGHGGGRSFTEVN